MFVSGSPCNQTHAVVSRFADLLYEVDDVIKNYARQKVAVNKSQSSIMSQLNSVKEKIDNLGKKYYHHFVHLPYCVK